MQFIQIRTILCKVKLNFTQNKTTIAPTAGDIHVLKFLGRNCLFPVPEFSVFYQIEYGLIFFFVVT